MGYNERMTAQQCNGPTLGQRDGRPISVIEAQKSFEDHLKVCREALQGLNVEIKEGARNNKDSDMDKTDVGSLKAEKAEILEKIKAIELERDRRGFSQAKK